MHDPSSVAHEIKYPWRKYGKKLGRNDFEKTYRESFITIWHEDPETGGSDDSCGWFTPPFSKELRGVVKSLAWDEAREPYFFVVDEKSNNDPVLCQMLLFSAFMKVSQAMMNRGLMRIPLSVKKAARWAAADADGFKSTLCFKSGYHSNTYTHNEERGELNSVEDDKFWREEQAKSFFGSIAGYILRDRRWWFQKPRWHFWHWRFQVHPWQQFRRWALSRCCKCGGMFKYGESPCTDAWNAPRPKFLRGETHIYHGDCRNPGAGPQMAKAE